MAVTTVEHGQQLTPPRLRLLDLLLDHVGGGTGARTDSLLADADVLVCRHLLGSTVAELETIRALLPEATIQAVLGKPYSANPSVRRELRRRGFPVDDESCRLPPRDTYVLGSYAARHRHVVRSRVDTWLAGAEVTTGSRPVLVVDDGGVLVDAVGHAVRDGRLRRPVVAVEQTTHGVYANGSHRLPLVNVAGSPAKLRHESPHIAESVVAETERWLGLLELPGLAGRSVGLVGYGSVGAHAATVLRRRGARPLVYDRNPAKNAIAAAAGAEPADSLADLLHASDLVVSAAGAATIRDGAAAGLRHGTVLASASSGDAEFRGLASWALQSHPVWPARSAVLDADAGLRVADDHGADGVHGLLTATSCDGRTVRVLNGGFPVNFTGEVDPIDPDVIQLTRALVVAAVVQAGRPETLHAAGVVPLDADLGRFVVSAYQSLRSGSTSG